jgi:hypothetical protein
MRREWRWALTVATTLTLGALCAEPYARLALPYYGVAARLIALRHPWRIVDLTIGPDTAGPGRVVRLTGLVRERNDDPDPAAKVISRLQVGALSESPIIFWTLLLLWPATSVRQRLAFLAFGVPVFLCLEAATSVCQLLNPMAYASAVLAGGAEPLTLWERWSRFIEGGGRIVLAICAAILTVTIAHRVNTAVLRGSQSKTSMNSRRRRPMQFILDQRRHLF